MRLEEAVEALRLTLPDLLLNTGDFLQHEPPAAKVAEAMHSIVLAARELGTPHMAILGNHDYYTGEESVALLSTWLRELDVDLLTNEMREVEIHGGRVTVAGMSEDAPGIEEAIGRLIRSLRPRIVMVHAPEVAERLPEGSADLVLAGHTHGGQITIPFLEKAIVRRFSGSRYVEGLYSINGNPVYVNRGLGCTGIPFRFRARPEVSFFRLAR
jgi:predicted MPP superfamily phosphohydrolase